MFEFSRTARLAILSRQAMPLGVEALEAAVEAALAAEAKPQSPQMPGAVRDILLFRALEQDGQKSVQCLSPAETSAFAGPCTPAA